MLVCLKPAQNVALMRAMFELQNSNKVELQ